jgi:type IV secretory pathway VirB10-like protein
MTHLTSLRLPRSPGTTIIQPRVKHVTFLALCLLAHGALAQQQSDSKARPAPGQDDLDVTMQIIVDPDAKLPDDVVRRIPLPERKPVESTRPNAGKQAEKADKAAAAEARETAREAKDVAKQEAAEQREQARRARAEERERNHPPKNPPGRPPRD